MFYQSEVGCCNINILSEAAQQEKRDKMRTEKATVPLDI